MRGSKRVEVGIGSGPARGGCLGRRQSFIVERDRDLRALRCEGCLQLSGESAGGFGLLTLFTAQGERQAHDYGLGLELTGERSKLRRHGWLGLER